MRVGETEDVRITIDSDGNTELTDYRFIVNFEDGQQVASGVPDIVNNGTRHIDLSFPFTPFVKGSYSVYYQITSGDEQPVFARNIIVTGSAPQDDYTRIYRWVRQLLKKDANDLDDGTIDLYADTIILRLQDVYPTLGAYEELSVSDRKFFDEGVGHLIAVRLRPTMGKDIPVGDIVRVHTQNTHFQFSDSPKSRKTLEQSWKDAGETALGRVTAIKASIVDLAFGFSMVIPAGPSRATTTLSPLRGLVDALTMDLNEIVAPSTNGDWVGVL